MSTQIMDAVSPRTESRIRLLSDQLTKVFTRPFSIWCGRAGECLAGDLDPDATSDKIIQVARSGKAELLLEEPAEALLAFPVAVEGREDLVAVGRVGLSLDCWSRQSALLFAESTSHRILAESQADRLRNEVSQLSQNLVHTYEELNLLYTVTRNLKLSSTEEELGRLALEWLEDCIPAHSFAIQYLPYLTQDDSQKSRKHPILIEKGDFPLDCEQFSELVEQLNVTLDDVPFIANASVTATRLPELSEIRQIVLVPLTEGDRCFGWLAAVNHHDDDDFGTVEGNLLASLGALLGIHSNNRDLYREQSEFLANVVRALVSAIDAKDPYTSGHSDRVSRIAVRLGIELGCNPKILNTLYMAGLLHDVGKIGINDNVLCKAGRLSDPEVEHIKLHPKLGHKILGDLKQLSEVLPAVLHHHEQWDGKGYPHGLEREAIPFIARIMAVADAYDAMTSNRPYRDGMPEEKVERIFRNGAGIQWDPTVVDAFFQAKADIESIASRERDKVDYLAEQWS